MKKLFGVKNAIVMVLAATFITVMAASFGAFATSGPIEPWITRISGDMHISSRGVATLTEETATGTGLYGAKVARFIYDGAVSGYTTGAHGLGVYLPAKAVLIRSYFKVITQFADSGTTTLALSCEDANNIKTATDITGSSANAFVEGASTGAASAFVRDIAAQCEITATVAGAAGNVLQAGKLVGWVHYVIED